jgi:hypothetical protein
LKKIIIVVLILIPISLIVLIYNVKLGTYNQANIAKDLFMNDNNRFDYNLLERRLNEKYGLINKREDLRSFIIRNGGGCNDNNICRLVVYSTFCISEIAIIELMSEPKINVRSFLDGC